MFIQPWDAALDDAEWQTWIADGHDFGILSVTGLLGHEPIVVPTHFTVNGKTLLVHLARHNPVWDTIEVDPERHVHRHRRLRRHPGPLARQAGRPAHRRRPHQLLRGRPVHLPGHHRRRAQGQGKAAAPPDGPLPAGRRPRSHRGRPPTLRADAARHPRPAPGRHRGPRQVQVRPPRTRRTARRHRPPTRRTRPGPGHVRRSPAKAPTEPPRYMESLTAPYPARPHGTDPLR